MSGKLNVKRNVSKKDFIIAAFIIVLIISNILTAHFVKVSLRPEILSPRETIRNNIKQLSRYNKKIDFILANFDEYPMDMLNGDYTSSKYINYLYNYPEHKDDYKNSEYTAAEKNTRVLTLFQYDPRWCYEYIHEGVTFYREGCVPTSVTMAYIALTGKYDLDPIKVANELNDKEYSGLLGFSGEGIIDFFECRGIKCELYNYPLFEGGVMHDEQIFIDALNEGKIIIGIVGEGHFTLTSHAILIRDYKNGVYYVNDPSSADNSIIGWSYEILANEGYHYFIIG